MKVIAKARSLFSSIGKFKARQYAALVGVAVSSVAIIAVAGLGLGAYLDIKEVFREVNRNSIYIEGRTARYTLGPKAIELIAEKAPSVGAATLLVKGQGQLSPGSGRMPLPVTVLGVTETYTDIFDLKIEAGTFLTATDQRYNLRVAVIGWDIVDALYGARPDKALGTLISVNGYPLEVVGVYSRINDDPEDYYGDDRVYVPYDVARQTVLRGSLPFIATNAKEYGLVPDALYELRLSVQDLYPHASPMDIRVVHIGDELVQAQKQALTTALMLVLVSLIVLIASGKGIADAAQLNSSSQVPAITMTMLASILGGLLGMLLSLGLEPLCEVFNVRFEQTIYGYVAVLLLSVFIGWVTAWSAKRAITRRLPKVRATV